MVDKWDAWLCNLVTIIIVGLMPSMSVQSLTILCFYMQFYIDPHVGLQLLRPSVLCYIDQLSDVIPQYDLFEIRILTYYDTQIYCYFIFQLLS